MGNQGGNVRFIYKTKVRLKTLISTFKPKLFKSMRKFYFRQSPGKNKFLFSKTWKIMRLFTFFFFVATLQISAKGYSQSVNLTASNITLKKAFRQIEQQTGYSFFVSHKLMEDTHPVSLSLKNATINEALQACLKDQSLTYAIIDKTVILKAAKKPDEILTQSSLPNIRISGMVTDSATGNPLPGVTIIVKDKKNTGVVTDAKGRFTLEVADDAVLEVRFLGYSSREISVDGRTVLHILLTPATKGLNQVVVIGYGEEKKRYLTEAISTIDSKELNYSPSSNVGNMLAGKTTGLIITQSSGYPYSDAPSILIRGISSLSAGRSQPLILVDGVKRNFFHMDPHNIKNISILKDAAATAIYGIEGANGVILVTTKRGHKGPAKFSVDLSAGFQQPINQPEFIGSYRYATLYNQAQISDGVSPDVVRFSDEALKAFKYHLYPQIYPDMDWLDYMLKKAAFQTQNHINVSGGTDKVKYFISGGFLRQSGLFKTYDVKFGGHDVFKDDAHYTKYNIRTNLDIDLTPSSRLTLTGYARYGVHSRVGNWASNQIISIYRGSPFGGAGLVPASKVGAPASYGLVLVTGNSEGNSYYIPDPKYDPLKLFYGEGLDMYTRSVVNLDLDFHQKLDFITKGLSAQFKASYNTTYEKYKNMTASEPEYQAYFRTDIDPTAAGDSSIAYKSFYRSSPLTYDESYMEGRSWYMELRLNYHRNFGQHSLTALALYNQRKQFYPDEFTGYPRGLVGSVLRLKDNYHGRYLLEVNMGYNGSENFAKGRRFGLFPSFSGGWIVSEEPFMKNIPFLSFLKLRASYGIVGSDVGEGRFLYLPGLFYINGQSSGGYNFGYNIPQNQKASKEGAQGNPLVTWETARKQDYGINMHFFKEQLSMRFDYFYEDRTNILSTLNTVPDYVNIPSLPPINLGEVINQGYEAKVGWKKDINANFSYQIGAHVTFARNKIMFMDEVHRQEPYLQKTGHPVGQPFGYVFERFYEPSDFNPDGSLSAKFPQPPFSVQPGDLKYRDLNGDGFVDQLDQRAIGYAGTPEFMFGGNIGFRYKNFSLITIWQGAAHVSRMFVEAPFRVAFGLAGQGAYGVFKWQADGAWTPEKGQKATYPRMTTKDVRRRNDMDSDFWLHDASYVRLKNAQISYDLPAGLVKRWGFTAMQVYMNGYDLLTFSDLLKKYSLDPERASSASGIRYPLQRVINFGVHLEF